MTGQASPHGSGRCSRIRRSPRPRSRTLMPSIEKPAPVLSPRFRPRSRKP